MAQRRPSGQQAPGHSRSTPNLSVSLDAQLSKANTASKDKTKGSTANGNTGASSQTQSGKKRPTFTPGAPSEPVSEDERDNGPGHDDANFSASSFERYLRSNSVSTDDDTSGEEGEGGDSKYLSPSSSAGTFPLTHSQSHTTGGSRPLLGQMPRSQSHLVAPSKTFAPPFYNRPPTPLPPSPSFTSLLRARPFSSALTSRPSTPDSSDTEATALSTGGPGNYSSTTLSAAAVAQSAMTAETVPRVSPKVPTYEYYGFVLYLGSSIAFFLYLLWSYLPTPFLHQLGIYYYPDRWWSLAVPSWLVMALIYMYIALASWNTGVLTLKLGNLECLVDEKGRVAVIDEQGHIVRDSRYERHVRHLDARHSAAGSVRAKAGRSKHDGRHKDGGYGVLGLGKARDGGYSPPSIDFLSAWDHGTDAVMDVPIGGVCEILYGAPSPAGEAGDGTGEEHG